MKIKIAMLSKGLPMRFELEKRTNPSNVLAYLSPIIAFALTLVSGMIIFTALGFNPFQALYLFFFEPLTEIWSVHELAIKAAPLIIIACGLALCFRSSNWNIGAEGQFIMGGLVGSILPVMMPEYSSFTVLPLILIMGMIGGALWAAIPAILKNKFGANEILTSLMLVYVAQLIVDYFARGPFRNPQGYNFPGSRTFTDWQVVPEMFSSGRAHYGVLFALIIVVLTWFVTAKTVKGFEISVVGKSQRGAGFAGFDTKRLTLTTFVVCGALAGLAGIVEVSGATQKLSETLSVNYGFTAIIVAFMGRLNPLGILAAGIVLALTFLGSEAIQVSLGVSDKIGAAFQGLILFFVLACDTLILYRIKWVSNRSGGASNANA